MQDLIGNLTGDIEKDFNMIAEMTASVVPLEASFIEQRLSLLLALKQYAASTSHTFSGNVTAIHVEKGNQSGDKVMKQLIAVS